MNILQWLFRGLLLSVASSFIALWVIIVTLNMTLFNRQAVLGWLDNSGAYSHVVGAVVNLQQVGGDGVLSQNALQQAVGNTLTPAFVRQASEAMVNGVYDWLGGKTSSISFYIPLNDKREELQKQLAAALESTFAKLPVCSGNDAGLSADNQTTCIPRGSTPAQLARQSAAQTVGGSDFLTQPLTSSSLGELNTSSFAWLPTIVQNLPALSVGLPIAALLCAGAYVALSRDRLAGGRTVAGHVFFGTALTFVVGIGVWYFGATLQFAQVADQTSSSLLHDVIEPIIHQIAPAIGMWLTIFAGSVLVASGGTWVALRVIGHHQRTKPDTATMPPGGVPMGATPVLPQDQQKSLGK